MAFEFYADQVGKAKQIATQQKKEQKVLQQNTNLPKLMNPFQQQPIMNNPLGAKSSPSVARGLSTPKANLNLQQTQQSLSPNSKPIAQGLQTPPVERNRSDVNELSYVAESGLQGLYGALDGLKNLPFTIGTAISKRLEPQIESMLIRAMDDNEKNIFTRNAEKLSGINIQELDKSQFANRKSVTDVYNEVSSREDFFDRSRNAYTEKWQDVELTGVARFTGDVAQGAMQMIPMITSNIVAPGSGLFVMFGQVVSRSFEEAVIDGANVEDATIYGIVNGAIETGTEMMFGGIPGMPKGVFTKGVENLVKNGIGGIASDSLMRFAKTDAGKGMIVKAIDILGEGAEEYLAEVFGSATQRIYKEMEGSALNDIAQTAFSKDAGYAALVGIATSAFMQLSNYGAAKGVQIALKSDPIHSLPRQQQKELILNFAKERNINVEFTIDLPDGQNGFYDVQSNTIIISEKTPRPYDFVLKHEFTHTLEQHPDYVNIREFSLINSLSEEGYQQEFERLKSLYENVLGFETDENYIKNEMFANFVGEVLFNDVDSLIRLSRRNPTIFDTIKTQLKKYSDSTLQDSLGLYVSEIEQMYELISRTDNLTNPEYVVPESDVAGFARDNVANDQEINRDRKMSLEFFDNDTRGNDLNIQQKLFFHNSQAKDEYNRLKVLYHGTSNGVFTEFDVNKIKSNLRFGFGFYFTDSENVSDHYATQFAENDSHVFRVYADIKNPLHINDQSVYELKHFTRDNMSKLLEYSDVQNIFKRLLVNQKVNGVEYSQEMLDKISNKEAKELYLDFEFNDFYKQLSDMVIINRMTNYFNDPNVYFEAMKNVFGVDGVIVTRRFAGSTEYVVFDSSQVKDMDNKQPSRSKNILMSLDYDSQNKQLSQEQMEKFKDSKIRDEKDNLLVVYHGSKSAGMRRFEGANNFFTDSIDVARSYTKDNSTIPNFDEFGGMENYAETLDINQQVFLEEFSKAANLEQMNEQLDSLQMEIIKNDDGEWQLQWQNGKFIKEFSDLNDIKENLFTDYLNDIDVVGEVQSFYLDIKNPLEIDAEGSSWSNINGMTTEQIVEQAKNDGYDGVVIKNVLDPTLTNIYVTYDSNQSKRTDNLRPTTSEDFRYSLDDTDYQNSRPKVRGGWDIKKIQNQLKKEKSSVVNVRELLKYNNVDDVLENIYYHGSTTSREILRAGSVLVEKASRWGREPTFDNFGGGYGETYHSISLSKSKNVASNFTAQSQTGAVTTVLLRKGANVIEMPSIQDSFELEEILPKLWSDKVDAVKIGDWDSEFSEQELVVLNPNSIAVFKEGNQYFQVYQKPRFENLSKKDIIDLIEQRKEKSISSLEKKIEKLNSDEKSFLYPTVEEKQLAIEIAIESITRIKKDVYKFLGDDSTQTNKNVSPELLDDVNQIENMLSDDFKQALANINMKKYEHPLLDNNFTDFVNKQNEVDVEDFSYETFMQLWKYTTQDIRKQNIIPYENSIEADSALKQSISINILDGWFSNADKSFKPMIERILLSDQNAFNASMNRAFFEMQTYKKGLYRDLSFDEFMDMEIELYRGNKNKSTIEDDVFWSFTPDIEMAKEYAGDNGYIERIKVKVKDTYGMPNIDGLYEFLVPTREYNKTTGAIDIKSLSNSKNVYNVDAIDKHIYRTNLIRDMQQEVQPNYEQNYVQYENMTYKNANDEFKVALNDHENNFGILDETSRKEFFDEWLNETLEFNKEYEDLFVEISDMIEETELNLKVIDTLLSKLPQPTNIETSSQSVSTYVTFNSADFDNVVNSLEYKKVNVNRLNIDETFTVRFSNQEVGEYRDDTNQIRSYGESDIEVDINNYLFEKKYSLDKVLIAGTQFEKDGKTYDLSKLNIDTEFIGLRKSLHSQENDYLAMNGFRKNTGGIPSKNNNVLLNKTMYSEHPLFESEFEYFDRKLDTKIKERKENFALNGDGALTYTERVTARFENILLLDSNWVLGNIVDGMFGEQQRMHLKNNQERVQSLVDMMDEDGYDPTSPIFITVDKNGDAFVSEGNHRLAAAQRLGLPVWAEIKYYDGGNYHTKTQFSPNYVSKQALAVINENVLYDNFGGYDKGVRSIHRLKDYGYEVQLEKEDVSTSELIAIHNTNIESLKELLNLGGLPMPSIAITKQQNNYEEFGDISLVLKPEVVDPKKTAVFDRDAYTPRKPAIMLRINHNVAEQYSDLFESFAATTQVKYGGKTFEVEPMDFSRIRSYLFAEPYRYSNGLLPTYYQEQIFDELFELTFRYAPLIAPETVTNMDSETFEDMYLNRDQSHLYTRMMKDNMPEYVEWLNNLTSEIFDKKVIRKPNVEELRYDGSRKPLSQTHYEYNLSNLVKAMNTPDLVGQESVFAGFGRIMAIAAKRFTSIDQIRRSQKLVDESTSEATNIKYEQIKERFYNWFDMLYLENNSVDMDNLIDNVAEHLKKGLNRETLESDLSEYNDTKFNKEILDSIYTILSDVENLKVSYFEAKPKRAVLFNEVAKAYIPYGEIDNNVVEQLEKFGVEVEFYDRFKAKRIKEVDKKYLFSLDDYSSIKPTDPEGKLPFKALEYRDMQYLSQKYKDISSDEFDSKNMNTALEHFPATHKYRGYMRRTMNEWLSVAERIGQLSKNMTEQELKIYAAQTWGNLKPNLKPQNWMKGTSNFVEFRIHQWTNAMFKGAELVPTKKPPAKKRKPKITPQETELSAFEQELNRKSLAIEFFDNYRGEIPEGYVNLTPQEKEQFEFIMNIPFSIKGTSSEQELEVLLDKMNQPIVKPIEEQKASVEPVLEPQEVEIFDEGNEITNEDVDLMQQQSEESLDYVEEFKPLDEPFEEGPERARVRTFQQSEINQNNLDDVSRVAIETMISNGEFDYVVSGDSKALNIAFGIVDADFNKAYNQFIGIVDSNKRITKNDIALGEVLVKRAVERGDAPKVVELITSLSILGTELGQSVQAMSMIRKLTPEGQLIQLNKTIDRIKRKHLETRNVNLQLDLSQEMVNKFIQAETQEARDLITDDIKQQIADQLPVTFMDKVNAWRYLSMLGNPRTHFRNVLGNTMFMPMKVMKDVIGMGLESVFVDDENKTKSWISRFSETDQRLIEIAKQDYELIQDALQSGAKYDMGTEIEMLRTVFKNKMLEKARILNFDALELEDAVALKKHYVTTFAQFVKAKKWNVDNLTLAQTNEASEYAMQEAKRMTFRDASAFASLLSHIERTNKVGGFLVAAVIPFKKTPTNIIKRGFEYSPLGLINNITNDAYQLHQGKINSTEYIERISRGLTGTGIAIMGAMLASMGFLNIEDDDLTSKERTYNNMFGMQRYSINAFGGTYSIDWLVPFTIPLIIGAEIQHQLEREHDQSLVNVMADAMSDIFGPVFELTMLDGVVRTLKSFSGSPAEYTGEALYSMVESYIGQFFPTLGGQIARIIDPTRRTTAPKREGKTSASIERFGRSIINKVPGLSFFNEPMINLRGEEVKQVDNVLARIALNMASPGYFNRGETTQQDIELQRVYAETKDTDVLPKTTPNNFTSNGVRHVLSAKERTEFGKLMGETSYSLLDELFANNMYNNLTTEEQTKLISDTHKYAYSVAKENILSNKGETLDDKWYTKIKNASSVDLKPSDYMSASIVYQNTTEGFFATRKQNYLNALKQSGYSKQQAVYLMENIANYTIDDKTQNQLNDLYGLFDFNFKFKFNN